MERALSLALTSEAEGNLPIGCVITLDDSVIAEGISAVLQPQYNPGRHAEIEAIRHVDPALWPRAREMTCYTTLEPCVMCAGTLLLHGFGRVVFGALDVDGGAGPILKHLPPYYDHGGVFTWDGPLMPRECDPLYRRADQAFAALPVGRAQWETPDEPPSVRQRLQTLEAWLADPDHPARPAQIRRLLTGLHEAPDDTHTPQLLDYSVALFSRTGYLKDYRDLARYAEAAGRRDILARVDETLRSSLPDIWIEQALQAGHLEAAIAQWYASEEHKRARLCADALLAATGANDPDLLASCRMSQVNWLIGRGSRRRYRRACALLRRLRDELSRAGASAYWPAILDELQRRWGTRPALLDELTRARLLE